ncbi:hypothetical protein TcG_10270, partial [Trypanosoma cruzi]
THTATLCRRVFLFLLFFVDGCVLPPTVIFDVGAVPHVSLPSSCASCCVDVPSCAPPHFFLLFQHTENKYLHGALRECSWRRRDVGLHPVLKWQRGCTMPAMREGVACSWGHSFLLVVFALLGACVALFVLTRDGWCHDGLL